MSEPTSINAKVRAVKVTEIRLGIVPAVEVEGYVGRNGPRRYLAAEIVAHVGPTGKVNEIKYSGQRLFSNGGTRPARSFSSDDPALKCVALSARRVAATAQQRAETGAR